MTSTVFTFPSLDISKNSFFLAGRTNRWKHEGRIGHSPLRNTITSLVFHAPLDSLLIVISLAPRD